MNQIAFGAKRTFHSFLRTSRKLLASFGLTAARFDLLYAMLYEHNHDSHYPPSIWQSQLRRKLGVSASVVSRMLKSLEALGWVTRAREGCRDGRQRVVTLSVDGWKRMKAARRVVTRSIQRLVYPAICFERHHLWHVRLDAMERLEAFHRGLTMSFGDAATLYFPWGHPDD